MATFTGNSSVNGGYYLSTKTFAIEVVSDDGGTLPGPASVKYVAIPFPLLFAVVPVVGLAFLMFLPMIGFALFGKAVAMRLTGHVAEGASSLAANIAPDLATGAAYMTGHKDEEKPAAKVTPELEKLEKEIEEKRS
jgi:hypothetical protein